MEKQARDQLKTTGIKINVNNNININNDTSINMNMKHLYTIKNKECIGSVVISNNNKTMTAL